MLEFNDALVKIRALMLDKHVEEIETAPVSDALNRIAAEDIGSNIDVPPADNSAMDGYTLYLAPNSPEPALPMTLPISQRINAGDIAKPLEPGTAARIFTGAEVPDQANSVVMQENCSGSACGKFVSINDGLRINGNIRPQGQDIAKGQVIIKQGTRLQAQHLALLASIGHTHINVYRRLKVSVFSTGDELVDAGLPLRKGQIYDSNRIMIEKACIELGCEIISSIRLEDTLASTIKAFEQHANKADLIISCGGVSVGDEDHVKPAVESLGKLDFWKIRIKPGKPFAFGQIGPCTFIGLPGNPVSAFVTHNLFSRTIIALLQGNQLFTLQSYFLKSGFQRNSRSNRPEFVRVQNQDGNAQLFENQSSGVLSSVCWADALALIPADTAIASGDLLEVYPL